MCLLRRVRQRLKAAWTYFKRRRPASIMPYNRVLSKPVMKSSHWQYNLPRSRPYSGIPTRGIPSPQKWFQYATRLEHYIAEDARIESLETSLKAVEVQARQTSKLIGESRMRLREDQDWLQSFHKSAKHLEPANTAVAPPLPIDRFGEYIGTRKQFQGYFNSIGHASKQGQELSMWEQQRRSLEGRQKDVNVNIGRPSPSSVQGTVYNKLELEKSRLSSLIEEQTTLMAMNQQSIEKQRADIHGHKTQRALRNLDYVLLSRFGVRSAQARPVSPKPPLVIMDPATEDYILDWLGTTASPGSEASSGCVIQTSVDDEVRNLPSAHIPNSEVVHESGETTQMIRSFREQCEALRADAESRRANTMLQRG